METDPGQVHQEELFEGKKQLRGLSEIKYFYFLISRNWRSERDDWK
jgi:hypothetical protein